MSYRRRRGLADRLSRGFRSEAAEKAVIAIILILALAFASGATYSIATNRPVSIVFLPGGGMMIFLRSMNMQTHAETIVVFVYYALGVSGLLLYARAVSRPADPRTTKYMLFFSFLLVLLSALGLYNGYIEKHLRM